MAFYVSMSAFIVANLAVIGFEMRKGQARAAQAFAYASSRGASRR